MVPTDAGVPTTVLLREFAPGFPGVVAPGKSVCCRYLEDPELDRVPAGTVLRLGGMTDCFQPAENKNRVTYELIRELNRKRIGYLIVTKSAMVADDEYVGIYDLELAYIQVTITATDDDRALVWSMRRRAGYRRGSLQWKNSNT